MNKDISFGTVARFGSELQKAFEIFTIEVKKAIQAIQNLLEAQEEIARESRRLIRNHRRRRCL